MVIFTTDLNMTKMKSISWLLLFVLIAFQARTQEPYAQHFSVSNGLPSNSVYSLLEDKQGFIWFTCDEGLFRYDGIHFKLYHSKQQNSYSGSGLFQDKLGRIWYENFDGNAFYINNDQLVKFSQKTKDNYYPLKATTKVIFIQEKCKIRAIDLKTLKPIKSFKVNQFAYACEVVGNKFYYIDQQKLYEIDEKLNQRKLLDLPFLAIESNMLIGSKNELYVIQKNSAENRIWKLNTNKLILKGTFDAKQVIQNVKIINDQLFLLTTKGVCSYKLPSFKKNENFFITKNTTDIIEDRKGNHWLSSSMDGLDIISDNPAKLYQFDGISPLRSINYNDQLLISSKNEKILFFNPIKNKLETIFSGSSNALPYYLFQDFENNELIYVQSDGYTYFTNIETKKLRLKTIFAIKHITPFDHKYKAFVSSGFNGFYCNKSNLKLHSTSDKWIQGLDKKDDGEVVFYRLPIGGRGKMIFIDQAKNELYFLTNTGTFLWSNGVVKRVTFAGKTAILNKIFYWNDQLMGLGVDGKIIDLKIKNHSSKNATLHTHDRVKQVRVVMNKLYIRTSREILVYSLKNNGITFLENTFDLSNLECSDFSIIDNTVWIMTSSGFIKWNTVIKNKTNKPGKFIVTSIKINNKESELNSSSSLKFNQNNIEIDFALLDYGVPTITNLEYKINKENWVEIDPFIRSLSFPALASGDYNIQIRGKVNNKTENFETFSFTIRPPFYTTTWFFFSILLVIILIIVWYYRNQIQENRTRDRLINDKIMLESNLNKSLLASIKSQMNPHFIFNALNTIQAYIYMNDRENASGYLSKFSKLTRSILEMSEKEEVTLVEEIDALKLYLDLEKMRFQEGFEYFLETNEIDLEQVKIPSMLIQPYVENAIKHGLLHSTNSKNLKLDFQLIDQSLYVQVDDNGIGRKRANELRIQRDRFHTGFSTDANEKRLKILNYDSTVSVSYIDKMDHNENATGTTVNLTIQLKK